MLVRFFWSPDFQSEGSSGERFWLRPVRSSLLESVVFKARKVSQNRLVALKLISAGTLATADLVKHFKAEAEAAASLAHPNIVPIFAVSMKASTISAWA